MKKIVCWFSAIAVIIFVFSIVGGFNNAFRIDCDSDLRHDNLDITTDLEKESGFFNPPVKYKQISDFINGYAWVEEEYNYYDHITGNYGMIDTAGNFVIPFIYEEVYVDSPCGFTWVCLAETEKWGLIDTAGIETAGNIILPFIYDDVYGDSPRDSTWVCREGKWGFIDTAGIETAGNIILPFIYDDVYDDSTRGFTWVYHAKTGKWGLIDTAGIDTVGKIILPYIYEDILDNRFYDDSPCWFTWVCLAETGKWGLIDTAGIDSFGNIIVPFIYDDVYSMDAEDHVWVILDGKTGIISGEGNVLVPAEYEDIFFYEDGIAAVMLGKKWGFIDSGNNVIVPFVYDYVSPFSNGLARVVIADDGNAYFPYSYSAPEMVWLKGKFGFVDMSGNVAVPIIYDYAFPQIDENGFITVKLDGRTGIIDKSGKVVVPFRDSLLMLKNTAAFIFVPAWRPFLLWYFGLTGRENVGSLDVLFQTRQTPLPVFLCANKQSEPPDHSDILPYISC